MAKILLVEDDVDLTTFVVDSLSIDHHTIEVAHDGITARTYLSVSRFDLIILDWNLPDTTGLEVCLEFRRAGGATPILFLTQRTNLVEKESAFNAGSDDYLTKPFHMKELGMRVKALLRRPVVIKEEKLTVADIVLDSSEHTVTKGGASLKLFPKDFALLEYLMRHCGQLFSAQALLESVWRADSEASVDTVRQSLMRLRKALLIGEQSVTIENLHGIGYRLQLREDHVNDSPERILPPL